MTEAAPTRPVLTMPPAEAAALVQHYARAGVILEYGSGGSTVIAAEQADKTIFSVESDAGWIAMMQAYFHANPPIAKVHLHHGNIGRTKAWGQPVNSAGFRRWPGYPNSVWDLQGFLHPDVILIDGRFRAACFLAALFRITRPVTVLWDDYKDRPPYHEVETLVKPVELIGRMARFEIVPTPLPVDRLGWIVETHLRPN